MKLLLDTHLLIWVARDSPRLPRSAARLIAAKSTILLFSVASIWEIAIKNRLDRANFKVDVGQLRRGLLNNGYEELDITAAHALATQSLPLIHFDPFDRLLVAQAEVEGMSLLTADKQLRPYGDFVLKV